MTTTIKAVYESGVFRPLAPLELEEGASVDIIVAAPRLSETPPTLKPDTRTPAEILAEIAAMPIEPGPEFNGTEHDKILYGSEGGA